MGFIRFPLLLASPFGAIEKRVSLSYERGGLALFFFCFLFRCFKYPTEIERFFVSYMPYKYYR